MQSIEPVSAHSPHPSKVKVVSETAQTPVSQPQADIDQPPTKALTKALTEPLTKAVTKPPYRFRVDSWLSHADALLLMRKRAQREAKQHRYAAAIQIFNQLTVYEPDNADHFANRGLMHYNLKHYEQALTDYDHALELNPELDKAYNNRANLHATQKNWLDAIDDYDEAIDINPLNIRARLNQAITLREMGAYDEAIAALDIAMFFQPESANLYAERGRTYQLQGEWNCAIADYNRALELTQRSPESATEQVDRINRKVLRWMNTFR